MSQSKSNSAIQNTKMIPGRIPSSNNPPETINTNPVSQYITHKRVPLSSSIQSDTSEPPAHSSNLNPVSIQVSIPARELRRKRSATITSIDSLSIQSIDNLRNNAGFVSGDDSSEDEYGLYQLKKTVSETELASGNETTKAESPYRSQSASNIRKAYSMNRYNYHQQPTTQDDSNHVRRFRSATTSNIDNPRTNLHSESFKAALNLQGRSGAFTPHDQPQSISKTTHTTLGATPPSVHTTNFTSSNSPFSSVRRIISQPEAPFNPESPTWLLSDLLASLSSHKEMDEYQIVAKGNSLVLLLQQNPGLKNEIVIKNFLHKIQFMFQHNISEVRSVGYKIVRYLASNYDSLVQLVQHKILIYIIITMSTTRSSLVEKEQALKLIREFLNIDNGTDNISIGVLKALIALIQSSNEHIEGETPLEQEPLGEPIGLSGSPVPEDFKIICIETLCEISLLKPELVFLSGGFKIIINAIVEGLIEMSSNCLLVIFKLLDFKRSRDYLRNGYDLISVISYFSTLSEHESGKNDNLTSLPNSVPFADNYTVNKIQKISFLVTLILKNFSGLMAFSIYNFGLLRELISNLKRKNSLVREYILDILFDILRIKSLPWLETSPIGVAIKQFNTYLNLESAHVSYAYDVRSEAHEDDENFGSTLVNHYRGLLALVLIKNDIIQYLINIIEENSNASISSKATLLLTNIYSISMQSIPLELVEKNVLFSATGNSHSSTLEIEKLARTSFDIERVTRNNKFVPTKKYNSNLKTHIEKINNSSRYNIDDVEFKLMINNTKILTIKEFEDWNWSLLLRLIQGPLKNPKRFDEVMEKNPKFFKRLMSFYRPFKFRFCNISTRVSNSSKFVTVGCQLMDLFLSLESGIKYLASNKVLPQITEILAQIDPYSGISTKEPILSKKRLQSTISGGYLKFIGRFSGSPQGLKLLEHWQIFTLLQNIVDSSANTNNTLLVVTLFKNVDFTLDSQFRIILLRSLKVSNIKIRTFIINELLPRLLLLKECEIFVIRILVTTLYDSSKQVVNNVVNMLNEFYKSKEYDGLDFLIKLNPSIRVLKKSPKGINLLVKFLTIPDGFKYLEDNGFIDQEFDKWANMSGFGYLSKIESLIQRRLFPYTARTGVIGMMGLTRVGQVMPKASTPFEPEASIKPNEPLCSILFFKYLLSTEEGLNYFSNFKQRNYLDQLVNEVEIISNQLKSNEGFKDLDNQDRSHIYLINTLKQNLWIIGNIALAKYGIQLLDPMYSVTLSKSIIVTIFDLFETCTIWQIRGICFYIIGMISCTIEGIEILDELEWVTACNIYGASIGMAYPRKEVGDIFGVEVSNPYRDMKFWGSKSSGGINILANGGYFGAESTLLPQQFSNSNNSLVGEVEEEEEELSMSNLQKVHEKILNLIHQLNSIFCKTERKSYKELIKIKKNSPGVFENVGLFLEIIRTIDRGNFKFHKRKFIFDLFSETKVLESLSKKERKNSIKV